MLSIREYLEAGETTISNLLFDHYQKNWFEIHHLSTQFFW